MSEPSPPHQASPLEALSAALAALTAGAAPGVVAVHSHRSRASGFVWRTGLVVTAAEALADDGDVTLTLPGGETLPATRAGADPSTDIALLRIAAAAAPVPLSHIRPPPGALALAVGGQDGGPLAALGAVAVAGPAWRSLRGGEIDARLELDLALRRAGEGSLVLDAGGRAFGMAVFGPRGRVLVIPSATIDRVAARLASHGRIGRGDLGLGLQPVRLAEGGTGAMVMHIDPAGPAIAAGLHQGDVLLTWNGEALPRIPVLLRRLGPDSVGQSVRLGLRRAGAALEASLTIAERPEP